jgi:hypothetical protein
MNKLKHGISTALRTKNGWCGFVIIGLGIFVLASTWHLSTTSSAGIGPGALPRVLGALISLAGLIIMASGSQSESEALEDWRWRGIICVLGAVILFAVSIRPLGLAFAVPIAFLCSSVGSKEVRPVETLLAALLLSIGSIVLFVIGLKLPIPVAPLFGW